MNIALLGCQAVKTTGKMAQRYQAISRNELDERKFFSDRKIL